MIVFTETVSGTIGVIFCTVLMEKGEAFHIKKL